MYEVLVFLFGRRTQRHKQALTAIVNVARDELLGKIPEFGKLGAQTLEIVSFPDQDFSLFDGRYIVKRGNLPVITFHVERPGVFRRKLKDMLVTARRQPERPQQASFDENLMTAYLALPQYELSFFKAFPIGRRDEGIDGLGR